MSGLTSANVNGLIRIRDVQSGIEADIVSDSTPPPYVSQVLQNRNARGATSKENPWWTYAIAAINAPTLRPGEKRFPTLYLAPGMDWVRTQIHEGGGSSNSHSRQVLSGPMGASR
jgi:hypothetical protein